MSFWDQTTAPPPETEPLGMVAMMRAVMGPDCEPCGDSGELAGGEDCPFCDERAVARPLRAPERATLAELLMGD